MQNKIKHRYGIFFSVIIFLSSCSKIEEKIQPEPHTFSTLTPQNIQTDLPVMNIVTDQQEFEDMYTNFYAAIEIDARLFLYRNNNLVIDNEKAELEIKGSHTAQFELKSLGITFEEPYDNSARNLLNPIAVLPIHNLDQIHACRLRNSGNDFLKTNIKDLCYTQTAIDAGLDIDLTYGEQMVVFVNGAFYGVMNLRSEGNSRGIAGFHNTVKNNVDLGKIENPGIITFKTGDPQRLDNYVSAIENKDLPFVLAHTDLHHFIDYIIFQSFIANNDWPYNNVRFYSIDGQPFRFVMYDLDWCNTLDLNKDPVHFIDPEKENMVTNLFVLLCTDENFKHHYETRYEQVLSMPALNPDNFNKRVDFFANTVSDAIILNIERYGAPGSMVEWYQEIALLKQHYQKRYNHFF